MPRVLRHYICVKPDLIIFNYQLNSNAEVVKAFIVSGEYRHRFGP